MCRACTIAGEHAYQLEAGCSASQRMEKTLKSYSRFSNDFHNYQNTKCEVLYLNFGTCKEGDIKYKVLSIKYKYSPDDNILSQPIRN